MMGLLQRLRHRLRDWRRGETDATFFDLHDLRALNAVFAEADFSPITTLPSPTDPTTLDLAEKGKRIFEVREDLRTVFPFGQTPHPDRGRFLLWMLTHGARDVGITPDEALAFLVVRDAEPDRGLVATYLVRPDWQDAVPDALTQSGWPKLLEYLRSKYHLRGRWFERATLHPSRVQSAALSAFGVNILAHFRYPSGLQEAAREIASGLERGDYRVSMRDLPVRFDRDHQDRERFDGLELFDTSIVVAAINTFPRVWYPRAGLRYRSGVYRIALWYWELEDVPADLVPEIQWPNEVWAPTRFLADGFRKAVCVPVVPMLPGLRLSPFTPRPRSHFALPDDRFLFLFTFDMGSSMVRKNPLGLIDAYRRAFRTDDRVHLAIKVSRGASDPDSLAQLQAAASDSGVTLIDRVMTRDEVLALFHTADCYVSLHRSEGLGLGLAESMLLGKPVIGTAYSGNLDFMTPDTSHLVRFDRVPLPASVGPYPAGAHWAEPSIDHAAALMRHVYDHPDESRAMGERAKAHVAVLLDPDAAAKRVTDRLAELRRIRPLC